MPFDAADLAAFVDPDMPGYALATIGGQPVPGLFGNGYSEAFGQMAGSQPRFRAPAGDLAGVVAGSAATILGKVYAVVEVQLPNDDPSGMGLLILESA